MQACKILLRLDDCVLRSAHVVHSWDFKLHCSFFQCLYHCTRCTHFAELVFWPHSNPLFVTCMHQNPPLQHSLLALVWQKEREQASQDGILKNASLLSHSVSACIGKPCQHCSSANEIMNSLSCMCAIYLYIRIKTLLRKH